MDLRSDGSIHSDSLSRFSALLYVTLLGRVGVLAAMCDKRQTGRIGSSKRDLVREQVIVRGDRDMIENWKKMFEAEKEEPDRSKGKPSLRAPEGRGGS